MKIVPIQAPMLDQLGPADAPGSGSDLAGSFAKALLDARGLEQKATEAASRFAEADPAMGIHEVMIATEKASVAVHYATTLKNRVVEAYRDLMNTPV